MTATGTRPPTNVESWSWRIGARCRGEDLALFFHPDGERGQARRQRQQLAKHVCAQCPVLEQCREHSLAFRELFGTWGGLSEDERSRLLPDRAVNLRTHRAHKQAYPHAIGTR
ncbi:WhiB family transcriptional regulator [Mycolicibacterium setense]